MSPPTRARARRRLAAQGSSRSPALHLAPSAAGALRRQVLASAGPREAGARAESSRAARPRGAPPRPYPKPSLARRRAAGHGRPHQQEARVAARKVLQRVHDGQQRQVLQRVAAQDELVAAGERPLRARGGPPASGHRLQYGMQHAVYALTQAVLQPLMVRTLPSAGQWAASVAVGPCTAGVRCA
jgi:hypothetical protein